MNTKQLKQSLFVALLAILAIGCGFRTVTPDAGHEAVLIRKPLLFGSGGVDGNPVKPGLRYVAWTTQAVDVNMQPARVDAQFDDLMTADGVPIDFHAVITYIVTDSVKLVRDFGADVTGQGVPGFWVRNLDQPFRTAVRDSVKKHGMNEMAIMATAAEAVDLEVTNHLLAIVKETGVPVKILDVSLGRANPPDALAIWGPVNATFISASRPRRRNSASIPKSSGSSPRTNARWPRRAARPPIRPTTRRWG